MGLCNEERFLRALNSLRSMMHDLDTREYTTWKDDHIKPQVDAVRDSAMQLIGMIIQQIDTSGAYWIMGENSDGFRGLTCEFFNAGESSNYLDLIMDEGRDIGGRDMNLVTFGGRMGFFKEDTLKSLANWWELWGYIPAILYPVNRYDDHLFSREFVQELNRLISHLMQLKKRVHCYRDLEQAEQVLLLKYRLFTEDVYSYEGEDRGDKHVNELIESLRNMTQKELDKEIKKRYHNRQNRANKSSDKKKRVDPIHGKGVVPMEDSIAILMDEFDCSRKIAAQALWRAFNHDIDKAREYVPLLLREEARRNPKVCKAYGCEKKLDPRNKSGYCREHLVKARRLKRLHEQS